MKIHIRMFDVLDRVAKSHCISDVEWAAAAEIRRPTIPELRRISRVSAAGIKDPRIRRACTMEKIIQLFAGLNKVIGSAVLNAELRNDLAIEYDQNLRLQLLLLMLKDAEKEKKDRAETMLKSVLDLFDTFPVNHKAVAMG